MFDNTNYFTFDYEEIKQDTGKAILVKLLVSGKEIWLPKKNVKIEGKKITIPEWLKKKKGL
jgi:hypothetical protein